MSTYRRSRKLQRGAAALEFALIAPVLIVIVFAIVDFGLMINAQAVVANASRDAARAGSFFANKAEIQGVVTSATTSLANVENVTTTVTCRKAANTACTGSYDVDRESGGVVSVKITYTYRWLTPNILGLPPTSTITKQSEMRIE